MLNPQRYTDHESIEARNAALVLLYSGWGCTMRINGEFNAAFDYRLWKWEDSNKQLLERAAEIWKLPPPDELP